MLRVVAISPQCRYRLGDCALVRLRPTTDRLVSSFSGCRRQSFHHVHTRAIDPPVFENSLEKTLELHRIANRKSIIRKVVSRSDPPKPNRSSDPPGKGTGSKSHNELSTSDAQQQATKAVTSNRRKQTAGIANRRRTGHAGSSLSQPVNWRVDVRRSKSGQWPWLGYLEQNHAFSGGVSQLDAEIRALEKYLTSTARENQTVDKVVSHATQLLEGIVPHRPEVIGSRRMGLAMSHSDLDLMLPVPDPAPSTDGIRKPSSTRPRMLREYRKVLQKVEQALRQSTYYGDKVQLSAGAHQAATAIHQPTGLQLHFYCGEDIPASIEYTMDFYAEYPSLRPLYIVTRLILETRGLFGRAESSLTPDALRMLIAAFLKLNHGRFAQKRDPSSSNNSLAHPLLAFLHTFGSEIDLTTTGVAVDPPGFFNAESIKQTTAAYDNNPAILPVHLVGQRALIKMKKSAAARGNTPLAAQLCLQDPANYMNDLGRFCSRTRELQAVFSEAHGRLKAAVDSWEPDGQHVGPRRSVLGSVLHANFGDFESRRRALQGFSN